jgi:hypothetical protein
MKMKTFGYAAVIAVAAVALSIGSATTSEAAKKKKAAAPPPQPQVCVWQQMSPVCGSLKGQKFTYANSCAAYKDGANVVSNKACPAKAAKGKGGKKKAKKASKKKAAKKM